MTQPWTAAEVGDQSGRIAVITGANSGIGLEVAKVLAARGATVVLAGRDPGRTAAAAGVVENGAPATAVHLDLASLESVHKAAAEITERFPRIDLLINNAGLMMPPHARTEDGFELQFGTNHLGHFALTGLVLNCLLEVPGSRVVTVSSNAHRAGRMRWHDLEWSRGYRRMPAYAQSKLANLLFSYELQRRLDAATAPTIAVAAHPGTARTELTRHLPGVATFFMGPKLRPLNSRFVQDAAMGALPTLRAATDPDAAGGDYYGPDGPFQLTGHPVRVRSSARSHDSVTQHRLWTESERLTSVHYPV